MSACECVPVCYCGAHLESVAPAVSRGRQPRPLQVLQRNKEMSRGLNGPFSLLTMRRESGGGLSSNHTPPRDLEVSQRYSTPRTAPEDSRFRPIGREGAILGDKDVLLLLWNRCTITLLLHGQCWANQVAE